MATVSTCRLKLNILIALLAAAGGCVTNQAYEAPKLDLPPPAARSQTLERQWWKAFGDPVLNQLVDYALVNNFDLAKAAANVAEARASAGSAAALLSPRLDAGIKADASKRQITSSLAPDDFNKHSSYAAAGVAASWEVDLWGRIRQMNDAALARLAASEHARNATDLSVSSAVTETYFQLRTFDKQLAITRDAAQRLRDVSDLEMRRWKANVGTELAYRQTMAEVAATEARIPVFETAVAKTELALQLLVGKSPRQIAEKIQRGGTLTIPDIPREFDTVLLLRRPDVASAEQLLVASHADVNAARAEFYPRLNLGLLVGALTSSSNIISGMPLFYDATASLMGPIYDGGLVQSKVDGAEARREKALAHYRYTVSLAFRDAYEAMILRDSGDKQVASSQYEVEMRRQSLGLTQRSYDAGRSSKYEVLSESIKVLNAELSLVGAQQNQLIARSQFYKALGGGF